jgi:tetratricopeptide (TPR) repeat protein
MNWKKYEKEILKYFQETYPETTISFDKTIVGKYSKVNRQIDILIEGEVAGYEIKIVVDCKNFSKNIDVKQVESFCSMVEDVEAHQGVLITQKGFSKAAVNRAYYGNHKVELDIINFDDLKELQSTTALPYSGHFAVVVPAPFGWVLDLKDKINSFATIHQRGLTLKDAQKKNEWMYMQFWKIDAPDFGIDKLIEIQNENILRVDPKAVFTYNSLVKRNDGFNTKTRIAEIKTYSALEVTGFIQFEGYILFIVLFTPKELLNKNLRKLQYLLKVANPCKLDFDNHKVINQRLVEITKTDDKQKQADAYYQVGIWYQEMDDFDNAFLNFKKAIECFPTHYHYLKGIIGKALTFGFIQESKHYATQLFDIEPINPTVPQDLIQIYLDYKQADKLIELFNELIDKNKKNEVLGNLNFHLGLLYFNTEQEAKGASYVAIAKQYFEKVLPKDHQVFKSIEEFERIKNNA